MATRQTRLPGSARTGLPAGAVTRSKALVEASNFLLYQDPVTVDSLELTM